MSFGSYNPQFICDGDSIVVGNNIYDVPGIYVDNFIASNSCDSLVYTNLNYFQSPSLNIFSNPNPPVICLGDSVVLEGSDGFVDYWWSDANGNTILVDDRLVSSPDIDTWYLLSAKDSNGCISKEDIWVYVDTCATGINSEILSNISIYPNPSSGLFTIEFNKVFDNNSNILIVNSIGDVIFSEELKIGESSKQINLSRFSKGIYFIELQTELGIYKNKIIIK
jgi:hypothetical protein